MTFEPLDSDTVAAITDAWHEHIVLLFRDREIDADQQIAFAENFGDVGVSLDPPSAVQGADYNASIMLVSNVKKNGEYIGSLPDGEMWFHHDMCYDKAPHKGTFLYAMELPSKAEILYSQTCIRLTKSCRKIQKNVF